VQFDTGIIVSSVLVPLIVVAWLPREPDKPVSDLRQRLVAAFSDHWRMLRDATDGPRPDTWPLMQSLAQKFAIACDEFPRQHPLIDEDTAVELAVATSAPIL